jgi:hypothetical protein
MNLETLATFRCEAWARRVLRRMSSARGAAPRPWPGQIAEARALAATLGRPQLVDTLAAIIQERASVAWNLALGALR